jgi:putative salt-induced outer membrane protein YdiY
MGPESDRKTRRRLRRRISVATLLFWLGVSPAARADHDKIDILDMKNGDRITCEVIGLQRGKLTVKTDGLGTLSVEWIKVQRLSSPVPFEVELTSGVRLVGPIDSPSNDQLRARTASGDVIVDLLSVVRLTPLEEGFWKRLDGSVNLGFSFTQADQLVQWSLSADVSRRYVKWMTEAYFDSLLTRQESADNQSRNALTITVERLFSNRWFAEGLAQFNQNEQLGLDFRSVTGGGGGRYVKQSNRTLFSVFAGAGYTHEEYLDQPANNLAEALFGVGWDWFTFSGMETDLSNRALVYYDLTSGERLRLEINSALKHKLFKDFQWTVNLVESFDSSPPEEQKRNDLAVTVSLGWTF